MANVVVAMYNYVAKKDAKGEASFPPFYEGFIRGLKNNGNNVLCYYHDVMTNDFPDRIPDEVLTELKRFKPDLFVFFNNNFWEIKDYFDVPIVIYDVDSPNLYVNKKKLKDAEDCYWFLVNQQNGKELIQHEYEIPDEKICYIPPFTEVHAKPEEIVTNIVFCGSHWLWSGCEFIYDYMKSQPNRKDRQLAQQVLRKFMDDPFVPYNEVYESLGEESINKMKYEMRSASGRLSGVKRARYLTNIADLGLEIRGNYWNHPSLNLFPEIALCYNHEEVVSLETTEQTYNSAKIGFNVNHIQAKAGFSWRVCDIMASNACLVTERTDDINTLFGDIGLPIYDSMQGAREQCIRVLNDEDYRLRTVERSNELINKNHRFINALDKMENFLKMKLHDDEQEGTLRIVKLKQEWMKPAPAPKLTPAAGLQKVERKIWSMLNNDLKKKNLI